MKSAHDVSHFKAVLRSGLAIGSFPERGATGLTCCHLAHGRIPPIGQSLSCTFSHYSEAGKRSAPKKRGPVTEGKRRVRPERRDFVSNPELEDADPGTGSHPDESKNPHQQIILLSQRRKHERTDKEDHSPAKWNEGHEHDRRLVSRALSDHLCETGDGQGIQSEALPARQAGLRGSTLSARTWDSYGLDIVTVVTPGLYV